MYCRKAERDYEEMGVISNRIDAGKPRMKYWNSNCFIDMCRSYEFPLRTFGGGRLSTDGD